MKKSILSLCLLAITANPISVYAYTADDCSIMVKRVERQVRHAEMNLNLKKEHEQMISEIADDARTNSRIAVALFTISTMILNSQSQKAVSWINGTLGGKNATIDPWIENAVIALIGHSRAALQVAIDAPFIMTVGAIGAGVVAEFRDVPRNVASKIDDGTITVQELIDVNRNFDQAQKVLDQERDSINLDYSQLTDFLGLRDRSATNKLLEIAQESRAIEELRLKHFQISLEAVQDACSTK